MVFNVLNREGFLLNTPSNSTFYQSLHALSTQHTGDLMVPVHKTWLPLRLTTDDSLATGVWTMLNQPITTGKKTFVRLNSFSAIDKERIGSDILRLNQQYQLVVNYNFVGDYTLGELVQNRIIRQVKKRLPVGYSVMENQQGFWNGAGLDLAFAVLITILIIFLLSAILLNSIRQALVVVMMIPISFMGVFLVVQLFRFDFDEGGFASFILLSGIVVNWALFILNDYNNFRHRERFRRQYGICYIKSFNLKITPILLSAASSLLGFVPFLAGGRSEPFWYSLAICTIGGLLFSVLATILIMPVFLPGGQQKKGVPKKANLW
jgi:multidrug efflux pump subunit AcrB